MSPRRLFLEVTETNNFIDGGEGHQGVLDEIRERGVRLMIDDFGTGFANLNYLRSMDFSTIKIDRQFVSGLPESRNDLEIVRLVVDLARQLGIGVIAEGVENNRQKDMLATFGCKLIQGWLFSPALAPDELLHEFVRGRLHAASAPDA